jgi:hypothetical protein
MHSFKLLQLQSLPPAHGIAYAGVVRCTISRVQPTARQSSRPLQLISTTYG